MRSLYAVYRKEMGHYFVSPTAYVVVAIFLCLTAWFFNIYLKEIVTSLGTQGDFDAPSQLLRAFLGGLFSILMLFLLPMITMGLFAEERKRGTMELLMTSPITERTIRPSASANATARGASTPVTSWLRPRDNPSISFARCSTREPG